jgi:hypothetical protein
MEAGAMPARITAGIANVALAAIGLACLALALAAGPSWAEHHFLPVWTWSWTVQLRILLALRLLLAAIGLAIAWPLRRWAVRECAAGRGRAALGTALRCVAAALAALLVAELVLRTMTWRAALEQWNFVYPARVPDAEYGWSFAPNQASTVTLDGRVVHYAIGPFGYRLPRAGAVPDFARPTVIFAGESIVFGYGLEWSETIPARVQALTGIQAADIAINAHATDQIYLRLRRELPRFAHPVAVVIPFMPRLLDRNLDGDKPHLDAQLRWHPAGAPPIRLVELARRMVRYRDPASITRGEATTTAVLAAAIAMVEKRGARAIILVPQYLPEVKGERDIRRQVLDRAGIPYLLVPVPQKWRSPTHQHPTPAGAAALAAAVAGAIDGMGTCRPGPCPVAPGGAQRNAVSQ